MESKKNDYLAHHGILGQKWGIRRYQNLDGTLTDAGKSRYRSEKDLRKAKKKYDKTVNKTSNYIKVYNKAADRMNSGEIQKFNDFYDKKNGGEDWVNRLGIESKEYQEYVDAYNSRFSEVFTEELIKMFGERPV